MQYLTILAVVTTLLQNAVPQTIDPTTVDDVTKGLFDEKLEISPGV